MPKYLPTYRKMLINKTYSRIWLDGCCAAALVNQEYRTQDPDKSTRAECSDKWILILNPRLRGQEMAKPGKCAGRKSGDDRSSLSKMLKSM